MLTIDTLYWAKRLKSVGFTEAQSEILVESYQQYFKSPETELATKEDIYGLLGLKQGISGAGDSLLHNLTINIGKMLALSSAIIIISLTILIKFL
jgi:hypothetical protein